MIVDHRVLKRILQVLRWQAYRKDNVLILIEQLFRAVKLWTAVNLVVVLSVSIDIAELRVGAVFDREGVLAEELQVLVLHHFLRLLLPVLVLLGGARLRRRRRRNVIVLDHGAANAA